MQPITIGFLSAIAIFGVLAVMLNGQSMIASEAYRTPKLNQKLLDLRREQQILSSKIRATVTDAKLTLWATQLGFTNQPVEPIVIGSPQAPLKSSK